MSEQEVYKELLWIAEYPGKEAVIAADEETFSTYSESEKQTFINSLIVLGMDKLNLDLLNIPMNDNNKTIPLSVDARHKNIVVGMSFLMNDEKDFELLLYFGGKAHPQTELKKGLFHSMKVLETIKQNT